MRSLCPWLPLFLVTVGALPVWSDGPVSCDYEDGTCVWKSSRGELLQWKRMRHNSNSYMFLDLSEAAVNKTALLTSGWLMGSANQRCQLHFGFSRSSYGCMAQLSVRLRTRTTRTELWNNAGKKTFAKLTSVIDVPCTEPRYQIMFEGSRISGGSGNCEIALDDVHYEKQPDPTTTEGNKTRQRKDAKISCDFKYGTCGWKKKAGTETLRWKRSTVITNPFDYYMSVQMKNAAVNQTATMISPWLKGSANQTCQLQLGFVTNTFSSSLRLSVLLRAGKELTVLWSTAQANVTEAELSPEIDVPCTQPRYQVLIEARKIGRRHGRLIGIDDIQYKQQALSTTEDSETQPGSDAKTSCDFKYGDCSWTSDKTKAVQWQRVSTLVFDNYIALDFHKAEVNDFGILSTPWLDGSAYRRCQLQLEFRFPPDNRNSQELSVLFRTDARSIVLRTTTGSQFAKPKSSQLLDIPCSGPRYQILLKGKKLRQSAMYIKVYSIDYTQNDPMTTIAAPTTEGIKPPPATEVSTLKTAKDVADATEARNTTTVTVDVAANVTEVRNVTLMTDDAAAANVTNPPQPTLEEADGSDSDRSSGVTVGFNLFVVAVTAVAVGGVGVGYAC